MDNKKLNFLYNQLTRKNHHQKIIRRMVMKELKSHILRPMMLVLVVASILTSVAVSYSQWTEEQQARINAAARKAEEEARNLPDHEKKIATFILERINKMIRENAKDNPNVKKEYSSAGLLVDDSGRLQVNVALLMSAPKSDNVVVANKIRELAGSVRLISNPKTRYPVEMYCCIPYEAVKVVSKLRQIGNISSVGFWVTGAFKRSDKK